MKIELINENTCILYLGEAINEQVAERVKWATDRIRNELTDVLVDVVPSYTSVLICYDLGRIDRFGIKARLRQALSGITSRDAGSALAREVEVPVYYGAEVALDLADISAHSGLSPEEVVAIHSETTYRVYAIGFSPGFAYLGNTDQRIAMPRKSTPRLRVPTGSLGIADTQTAIYPSCTPGGWQIIGRTPLKMIDWETDSLALMEVGDRVRFLPISREQFLDLGGCLHEL